MEFSHITVGANELQRQSPQDMVASETDNRLRNKYLSKTPPGEHLCDYLPHQKQNYAFSTSCVWFYSFELFEYSKRQHKGKFHENEVV